MYWRHLLTVPILDPPPVRADQTPLLLQGTPDGRQVAEAHPAERYRLQVFRAALMSTAMLRHPCARQRQGHDHPPRRVMTKANPLPPAELLRYLFDYNEKTGDLIWKNPLYRTTKTGSTAGTLTSKGYVQVRVAGRTYRAHRLVWMHVTGFDPHGFQIDHIDCNRSNNKFSNLRLADHGENARNRKIRKDSASGLKGVYYDKKAQRYRAMICVDRKQRNLGYFHTPELAHMAYCKAAAELHGDFARAM